MNLQPLETPVLRVSRPVAACLRCRNAKVKCDGKLPACTPCEKNGRAEECTSPNDEFARGKERSYVSTLEARVEKLQMKIEEAKARKPSVVSLPDDESGERSRQNSQVNQEPATPNTSRVQRKQETMAIDDLVSGFGFLSVNATARDFYGFTTVMSYARLVLSACSKEPLPQGRTTPLPPRYSTIGLLQFYFDNVFVLHPAFDEASFYSSVDRVYANNTNLAQPLDHCIVRLVLAIASISLSNQRGDQHYLEGNGHVCAALEHAESVLHPGEISNVQILVLLTQYAMLDPHHFDSWTLIGAASRAMTDLGLHNDPPKGTVMTKGKLELRRKVFYSVYTLDRAISLVQTRAFSFSDESTNVKIPFHKQQISAPNSPSGDMGSPSPWAQPKDLAFHVVKLRQIQSGWYMELFQSGHTRWQEPYHYLWNTCQAMRAWFDNLGSSLVPSMRTYFELDLLYSYIFVLSPSPRVPTPATFAQKLTLEYSITYAAKMLAFISDPEHSALVTFYDAMKVWMIGRQFLGALQHSADVLLNGSRPAPPQVKPTTAPPPLMPVVPIPPGETEARLNTRRSIECIQQVTECLARFGVRWGYTSWHQRYQIETGSVLEDLKQRLGAMDEADGARRQSMWQGSIGSIPSSSGSVSYQMPQAPSNPGSYQQTPPQMIPMPYNIDNSSPPLHPPAPQFVDQSMAYSQQMSSQPMLSYDPNQQAYAQNQQQAPPSFNFNVTMDHPSQRPTTAPSHQFANWTGYDGAVVENTLDEENAGTADVQIAPNVNPVPSAASTAMRDASAAETQQSAISGVETTDWHPSAQSLPTTSVGNTEAGADGTSTRDLPIPGTAGDLWLPMSERYIATHPFISATGTSVAKYSVESWYLGLGNRPYKKRHRHQSDRPHPSGAGAVASGQHSSAAPPAFADEAAIIERSAQLAGKLAQGEEQSQVPATSSATEESRRDTKGKAAARPMNQDLDRFNAITNEIMFGVQPQSSGPAEGVREGREEEGGIDEGEEDYVVYTEHLDPHRRRSSRSGAGPSRQA